MWMKPEAYLKRLQNTLEQVVAPEIEDDAVRGQLYAVVDLLNQLGGKIEYKRDLIAAEINAGQTMLSRLLGEMERAGVASPEALSGFAAELSRGERPFGLNLQQEIEENLCRALDHFHASKNKLGPELTARLDRELRDYMLKTATREMGQLKPPQLERISRSKRPPRQKTGPGL
jgi:hypothetical protein